MRSETADRTLASDRGFGLVEVIVTISLMSIALVPIMLAAVMTLRASSQSRINARVETVLANAADRVTRAPAKSCDYTVYIQAAAQAQGWDANQVSATYAYYQPPAAGPTAEGTWIADPDGCPNGMQPDRLVQRVTITVVSPDGSVRRTMEVVKSDV
jgi:prepilin-type N-terminal cleavage/methylation domain-containing protein